MKIIITFLTILSIKNLALAQNDILVDSNTTFSARKIFKENLIANTIENNLRLQLNNDNEKAWMSAFWGMELILYKNNLAVLSLKNALNDYENRSDEFSRAALEATYTLFPQEFVGEVKNILKKTKNPKHFAMAFNYLERVEPSTYNHNSYGILVAKNFPDWMNNPILFLLNEHLLYKYKEMQRPPLIDLLYHNFVNGSYIFYSLQRSNRDYPGLLLIKKPNGNFLRRDDGTIFNISQLARSINNLPGYLTNGNTPQGIFSFQGLDTSRNYFIGKTPNIQLVLPFEVDAKNYFHSEVNLVWDKDLYESLLPTSWREYTPFYEAFYAGKAGRNEIIAHGTTIDLDYYAGQPYYPNTPTLGCLCAIEIWDQDNGQRIYSDQAALISEINKLKITSGFFVVVEIDSKNSPVTLNEVLNDVLQAEKYFVK